MKTLTVKQLREAMEGFDDNDPVLVHFDRIQKTDRDVVIYIGSVRLGNDDGAFAECPTLFVYQKE